MVSVSDVWRAIAEAGAHECALAEKEGIKERKKEREGKEAAASSQRALAAPTLPGAPAAPAAAESSPSSAPCCLLGDASPLGDTAQQLAQGGGGGGGGGAADPVIGEAATLQMKD